MRTPSSGEDLNAHQAMRGRRVESPGQVLPVMAGPGALRSTAVFNQAQRLKIA